jgi:peptidoglycan hydrolase CwlO-like protein
MEWIAWVIAALATISNIIHAWTGRANKKREESVKGAVRNAVTEATLLQKIESISERIEEIKLDMNMYLTETKKTTKDIAEIQERLKYHDRRLSKLESVNP